MFGQGRLCAVTDDSGSTVYGYDRRGQVISEAHAVKGNSYLPLQYGYDAAGGRTKVVYPTGDVITTTYDLGGRPLSMTVTPPGGSATPLVTAITHKPFGPISGFTTAAGVVETRTFDTRYRRQSQTTVGAAGASNPLVSLSYTNYDKEGNLLQLDDLSLSPAVSQLFSYDPDRYFLVGATGPYLPGLATKQFQWGYDANGNRLFETASPGETRSFGYESWYDEYGVLRHSGVLTNISTAPDGNTVLESDFGGNLIGEGLVVGKRYSYDALARLKQVTSVSGIRPRHRESVVAFEHDATGHRVHAALTVGGFGPVVIQTLEDFVYGVDGSLYQWNRSGDGATTTRESYIYLEGEPVATLSSAFSGTYFLHGDHLGRPIAQTGPDGTLTWRGDFEPFGAKVGDRVGPTGPEVRFRFPGQWDGGELAGTDNFHRTYRPDWGRYIQPDPIPQASDLGGFAYVSNRPLLFSDPEGLYETGQVLCRNAPGLGKAGADVVIVVKDGNGPTYRGDLNEKVAVATFGLNPYTGRSAEEVKCGGAVIVNADPVRPSPLTKKKRSDDPYAGYSDVVHVSTKRMTPPVTVEEIRRRVDEWNAKNRCVYGDKKLCSDFVNFVAFGKDTSFAPVPTLCGR